MRFVIIFCMHAFMIFTVFSVVYIYGSIYEWVETTRYLHDLSDVFLVSCACGFAGFSNVSATGKMEKRRVKLMVIEDTGR